MMPADFRDFHNRAIKIIEGITDGTLLILKGHLLLEQSLYQLVSAKCAHPEYLGKAQLRFYQLVNVARALYPFASPVDEKDRLFWDVLEAFNTLRNQLAHRLEPKDLTPLLERIGIGKSEDPISLENSTVVDQLGDTIAFLVGMTWGLSFSESAITKK
jgi:hypothetical protein